jgi:hypothetical protein
VLQRYAFRIKNSDRAPTHPGSTHQKRQVIATVAANTSLIATNTSIVIANREAVKQSRRKATITGSSGLLRLWLAMTGVVVQYDGTSENFNAFAPIIGKSGFAEKCVTSYDGKFCCLCKAIPPKNI